MPCRAVLLAILAGACALLPNALSAQTAPVEVTTGQMQMSPEDTAEEAGISALAPAQSLRPDLRDLWEIPAMRWDDNPRGTSWSMAVMSSLRGHGAPLLDVVPRDIQTWCPGYVNGDRGDRAAFWAGLISALAWHESTHRPQAVGGGGLWFGLTQIAPPTARFRNCDVETGQALLDGPANLRCAIRIMAITVPRDSVVSEGMRGVAADWGPFHSRRKREDMMAWVSGQEYCQLPPRPALRPEGFADLVDEVRQAALPQERPELVASDTSE